MTNFLSRIVIAAVIGGFAVLTFLWSVFRGGPIL